MFDNYSYTAAERLMRYVQTDTQSDPKSTSFPSTEKQKDLSRILVSELQELGIVDAHMDEFGYVYASLPYNKKKNVPVICFCSHVFFFRCNFDWTPASGMDYNVHSNTRTTLDCEIVR